MNKLTKQEVLDTIDLINNGDEKILDKSALDFFAELNGLILNITNKEKKVIIDFITSTVTNWNDLSFEYKEYGNFLYKNITTNNNKTIIKVYETDTDDSIKKITTLTLLT